MAHREFRTPDGREWVVWSVHPEYAERRALTADASRPRVERRVRSEVRASLGANFSRGWLVFETRGEKRRMSPYPEDWADRSDEELAELLAQAKPVKHIRRRLVE